MPILLIDQSPSHSMPTHYPNESEIIKFLREFDWKDPWPHLARHPSGLLVTPQLDGQKNPVEELVILIHPHNPEVYIDNNLNPNFKRTINHLVKDLQGPILLGFEHVRLPLTEQWLSELCPKGKRFVYLTPCSDPYPKDFNLRDFAGVIKAIFNPKMIRVGGAELHGCPEHGRVGCVNFTYKFLNEYFEAIVDEGISWREHNNPCFGADCQFSRNSG